MENRCRYNESTPSHFPVTPDVTDGATDKLFKSGPELERVQRSTPVAVVVTEHIQQLVCAMEISTQF
jgi:hypothetical protein